MQGLMMNSPSRDKETPPGGLHTKKNKEKRIETRNKKR